MTKASRYLSDYDRMVTLFGERKDTYPRSEMMRLTRTSGRELNAWIDARALSPDDQGRFGWEDAAFVAVAERWGIRRITSALIRNGREELVPPLNRLVRANVQLPLYQVRALQEAAARISGTARAHHGLSDMLTAVLSLWIATGEHAVDPAFQDADGWPLSVSDPGTDDFAP